MPKRVSDDFGRFVFRRQKKRSAKISDRKFCFSPIWRGFGRATAERMSKSACSSNFALDRLIERPVRPKILGFGENLGFLKNFHSIVGDRFSGGFFSTASHDEVSTRRRVDASMNRRVDTSTRQRVDA